MGWDICRTLAWHTVGLMMMVQRQATHVELVSHDFSLFLVQILFDSLMDSSLVLKTTGYGMGDSSYTGWNQRDLLSDSRL